MHKDRIILENFIHRNTGMEFAGGDKGCLVGLQCTNPKQWKRFLSKQKKRLKRGYHEK